MPLDLPDDRQAVDGMLALFGGDSSDLENLVRLLGKLLFLALFLWGSRYRLFVRMGVVLFK